MFFFLNSIYSGYMFNFLFLCKTHIFCRNYLTIYFYLFIFSFIAAFELALCVLGVVCLLPNNLVNFFIIIFTSYFHAKGK